MSRVFGANGPALMAGLLSLVTCAGAVLLMPRAWYEVVHENALDLVLATDQQVRPVSNTESRARVIVVDIDRHSLEGIGPWPWTRDTMARLVGAVSALNPEVIAIDILFSDVDTRSPAALARRLGALAGKPEIAALADSLPDGDRQLAATMGNQQVALGFVLDAGQSGTVSSAPVLLQGMVQLDQIWQAPGAVGPVRQLSEVAAGIGALSLPGDADGVVRRVPILVGVGGMLRPGLAVEIARLLQRSSSYLVQSKPQRIAIGTSQVPLPADGFLRLVPGDPSQQHARTISALDLLDRKLDPARLAGAIVLIGGSAPELGGLRPTATDPLTASVQIHADAVAQIIAKRFPLSVSSRNDVLLMLGVGVIALAAAAMLAPFLGVIVLTASVAILWMASVALSILTDRLVDPLLPSLCGVTVYVATSVVASASARKRAARIRQRFEQHLAPAVVRRIVEEPGLLKLSGERREVTALFTDIQNFTAMTHRADPADLVAALDAYIEGITGLVISHGGMVDKIVGDAVHALFNAPIDLDHHCVRAVECAIALRAWTREFMSRPDASSLGFERTRIGVETGMAIVGDIGIRTKLDYTAHGDAVNAAARLEAANKTLGSSICLGPAVASRLDPSTIRPLGNISVQGRDDLISVFEPWPTEMTAELRESYLKAFRAIDGDPGLAAELFESLDREWPNDPVVSLRAKQLRAIDGLAAGSVS